MRFFPRKVKSFHVVVLLFSIGAFLFAKVQHVSVWGILNSFRWVEFLLVGYVLMNTNKHQNDLEVCLKVLYFLIVCNLSLHLAQVFIGQPFTLIKGPDYLRTSGGFFNDSSEFGPVMLLLGYFFYDLRQRTNFQQNKFINVVAILICIMCVVVSFNRTSLIALVPLLATQIWMIIFLPFFYFMFSGIFSSQKYQELFNILTDLENLKEIGTVKLRLENWDLIFTRLPDHLLTVLFGNGYKWVEINLAPYVIQNGIFAVDNTFLRVFTEFGLIGVMCVLALFWFSNISLPMKLSLFILCMTLELSESVPLMSALILVHALVRSIYQKGIHRVHE